MKILAGDILNCMANPFLLTDKSGKVLRMNEPVEALLRLAGKPRPDFIHDVDPALRPPWGKGTKPKTVRIGRVPQKLHLFPVETDEAEDGYLFMFDTPRVLKKMDFDTFLDYIDDSIIVADRNTELDHVNSVSQELTGIRKVGLGDTLKDLERNGKFDESGTIKVLKSKKAETVNMHFHTGHVVTYTCIPFFDRNGDVSEIISTGRNVTKLIKLQENLKQTEDLKNRYRDRLKELESLVGIKKIIHASEEMEAISRLAVKAAKTDSPVLIWGESGVGKELVADLIHKSGSRSKKPFVAVNCAAIPSELLEAEFFGYEEGAFTGAKKSGKKGLFEEAGDGTIFFDEITELPFPMQSKLLRVVQEKEFKRVGGTRDVPFRARVISASNLTQEELLDPARFRRDLFYRLSVIPIFIPPLRDRREDIFPLVRSFLKNMNLKYDTNVRITPGLMAKFYNYNWPGNVRELKNIIERLIVITDKSEVDVEEYRAISRLEERVVVKTADNRHQDGGSDGGITVTRLMPMKTAQQKVEELLITMAFKECRTIVKTAEILQINPCTIHRRIKTGLIRLE